LRGNQGTQGANTRDGHRSGAYCTYYLGLMLVREGKGLDLEDIVLAEQAVEVEAEGVSGEFGVQAGSEARERVGVVDRNVELFLELVVDGLDDLASAIEHVADGRGQLPLLIPTRDGEEGDLALLPEGGGNHCTNVGLVGDDIEVGVLVQQFLADGQVAGIGRGWNGAKRRGQSPGSRRPW